MVELLIVALAGFGAGIINTAVGAGSLVSYPALFLSGLSPVAANITNTIGLVPGSISGVWAYRRELRGQRRAIMRLVPIAIIGAIVGATLLLILPSRAFQIVVPILIILSAVLVAAQPWVTRGRQRESETVSPSAPLWVGAASIYGGYFSAAQGIILLGILGLVGPQGIQVQNALKNLLQATVNVVAAIFFLVFATSLIGIPEAACVALGSLLGAPVGAALARKMPAHLLRIFVLLYGLTVGIYLLITTLD